MTPDPNRARLEELMGVDATQGLSPREANELDELLDDFPDEDAEAMELAAAAVHLALLGAPEPLPPALAEKLHLTAVAVAPPPSPKLPRPRAAWVAWAGWVVAAGLGGVVVYTNWPKREPTVAERREGLKAPEFVGKKDAAAGSIVWSDEQQIGFMELEGLPPLAPAAGTYQLWIVDGARKGSEPIDGGVFRVNPDGTALVEIRPPIQVKNAVAFAITKESEPGGVVVSKVKPENYELVLTPKKG